MQWSITSKTLSDDVERQEKEREAEQYWQSLIGSMRSHPGRWHEMHGVDAATIRARLEPKDRGSLELMVEENPQAKGWYKVCYRETPVVPKAAGAAKPHIREDGAELDGDGYWWKDGEIVGNVFDGTERPGYRS